MIKQLALRILLFSSGFIMVLALGACGFHIRGSNESGNSLSSLHIKGENRFDDIAAEVKNLAMNQGITLDNQSEWAIELGDEDIEKWQASTTQSRTTTEYIIRLTVSFRISHLDHELKPITLAAEGIFQDNADLTASKDNEQALIIGELRRRLAADILRQTAFISANAPDCQTNHEHQAAPASR